MRRMVDLLCWWWICGVFRLWWIVCWLIVLLWWVCSIWRLVCGWILVGFWWWCWRMVVWWCIFWDGWRIRIGVVIVLVCCWLCWIFVFWVGGWFWVSVRWWLGLGMWLVLVLMWLGCFSRRLVFGILLCWGCVWWW